jgi:hypothetical protein
MRTTRGQRENSGLKHNVSSRSEIVAAFERESARLQRRGAGYLGKLEHRLKELLP